MLCPSKRMERNVRAVGEALEESRLLTEAWERRVRYAACKFCSAIRFQQHVACLLSHCRGRCTAPAGFTFRQIKSLVGASYVFVVGTSRTPTWPPSFSVFLQLTYILPKGFARNSQCSMHS